MTDKRVITDDAGQELSDLQLRVPAEWIFMREDTEKARSLDSLGLSIQLDGLCTSVELAEISGRQHGHIIRDIEEMESKLTDETHMMLGILRSTYVDGRGRQQPLIVLTEAAALWAVSKWDDELRARIVLMFAVYHARERESLLVARSHHETDKLKALARVSELESMIQFSPDSVKKERQRLKIANRR